MHYCKYEIDFVFLKHIEFLSMSLCQTLFIGVDIIMGDNMLRQRGADLRCEKKETKTRLTIDNVSVSGPVPGRRRGL